MYKALVFLKKTGEEKIVNHFREYTLKYISEIAGKEIKAAAVEANLLLEDKYSYYCELTADSKDHMDQLMNTKAGKELSRDMIEFHKYITIIFVNYNNSL